MYIDTDSIPIGPSHHPCHQTHRPQPPSMPPAQTSLAQPPSQASLAQPPSQAQPASPDHQPSQPSPPAKPSQPAKPPSPFPLSLLPRGGRVSCVSCR